MARPVVGPPSIQLRSNLSNILVAELISVEQDGSLTFKKNSDIHNTAETELVEIVGDPRTAAGLDIGQRYIIAYIAWESVRQPKIVRPRPGGAVFLSLTGAEPAIFRYNEDIETFLRWDLDKSLDSPKSMLPIILRGIQQQDEFVRNFFMAEVVLRNNLYQHFSAENKSVLMHQLGDPMTSDRIKQLMLSEADFLETITSDQQSLCAVLQNILAYSSTELNPMGRRAGVIRSALMHMRSCSLWTDMDVVSRWVLSDVPSVIEAALESLHYKQPGSDLEAVETALQQSMLNKNTREVLHNYRKRMKRADTR